MFIYIPANDDGDTLLKDGVAQKNSVLPDAVGLDRNASSHLPDALFLKKNDALKCSCGNQPFDEPKWSTLASRCEA